MTNRNAHPEPTISETRAANFRKNSCICLFIFGYRIAPGEAASIPGRVTERRYGGAASTFLVAVTPELEVEILAPSNGAAVGETVALGLQPGALLPWLFAADEPA